MEDTSCLQDGGDNSEISENDASILQVIPLEDYNVKKAKLKASLKWMVAKAYPRYDDAPPDLQDPFFRDAEGEDHLKPSVIYQLASAELYSLACTHAFPPSLHQWQGHWNIIQGLSRKGVYVVDDKDQPVTETTLAQTQRIKLSSHLAMMDAIQRAYVAEVASIEKVVRAVRKIATFSASSELPFDLEDALLFWMNKVCTAIRHQMDKERKSHKENLMQSSPQKVRLRHDQLQTKVLPSIPVMDDIMKDLGDGCCLAVLIHYYCPHLMSLNDISLQEPMSFANSIHNLNIIEDFFHEHLPKVYPFKPEDLLYSPACLKANILAMLGEVFHMLEVTKPDHLRIGQEKVPEACIKPSDGISSKLPPLPISVATKKSFHNNLTANVMGSELKNSASNPELDQLGNTGQIGQQNMLRKHQRQIQGMSLHVGNGDEEDSLQSQLRRATSLDDIDGGKRSFVAWQKPEDGQDGLSSSAAIHSSEPERTSVNDSHASSLLTNVSLDSELGQSLNIDELNESHNGQLYINQKMTVSETRAEAFAMPEYVDEDDLEVESLTSALSRASRSSEKAQPLQVKRLDNSPAVAREVLNGHQKSQYNGTKDMYEARLNQSEHNRTEGAIVQSPSRLYGSDDQSNLVSTLGGQNNEQLDLSCNRKKLTLDIQPVPTGQERSRPQEKLMPAVVRPLKEKSHSANKQDERGVLSQGRSPRQMAEPNTRMVGSGVNDLSPDLEPTTPLSPESIADSLASDFSLHKNNLSQFRTPFQPLNQNVSQEPKLSKAKHGDAFYIHADADHNASLQGSMQNLRPYPSSSFTVVDKQHTLESAQQAGIPVVASVEEMQRSRQPSYQTMDAGRGGGSPRVSQSNTYSHSFPHLHTSPNPYTNPKPYPNPQANPNHVPLHNPHMHSYSPAHSYTPPPLNTPPPPPPFGNPYYTEPHQQNTNYPNLQQSNSPHPNLQQSNSPHPNLQQSNSPHLNPHTNAHRSSPQYTSSHASPQPAFHGNPQYTGDVGGGGSSIRGGRAELTRFGNPGMASSVNLSPPQCNGDKESPKLHADQTERESAFRPPVLLTFDTNLSPEKLLESPQFVPVSNIDSNSQSHLPTNNINQVDVTYTTNSPELISSRSKTNPLLNYYSQMDDPLDNQSNLTNPKSMLDKDLNLPSDIFSNITDPSHKMTTWVSHSKHAPHINAINTGHGVPSHHNKLEPLAIGLTQVRLKLEEKRRAMDKDKRTLERQWTKQRQRVGKAAFMQVLANQKRAKEAENVVSNASPEGSLGRGLNKPYYREEIERSLQEAQSRWLHEQDNQPGKTTFAALSMNKEKTSGSGSTHSRDSDSPRAHSDSPHSAAEMNSKGSPGSSSGSHSPLQMTAEQYNSSLDKMNDNMSQLMREIQKLSLQQEQLKSAVESPRQPASQPTNSSHSHSPPQSVVEQPGFILHGNTENRQSPNNQSFFLGKQSSSPPGPLPTEPDNEPFVLQENPLFGMKEQLSPPTGRPVGLEVQSPRAQDTGAFPGSLKDNYSTYVKSKPKSRPKLNFDQENDKSESLASKRGQQVTPVDTLTISKSVGSEGPLSLDDLDRSPCNQGFRLHSVNDVENNAVAQVVQVNAYKPAVGFEIVDEPKQARKTPPHVQSPLQTPTQQSERKPRVRRTPSASSPTKKRPPSVYEMVGETEPDVTGEQMVVRPLDESSKEEIDDSGDSKVLGFVIAQDMNEEDEIAKKRDQFLRSRLKKQEEEKAKKAAREAQAEKLKEEHRKKQDEIEAKKAKEIERREKIRLAYQKKKQKEQDEQDGPPLRERKSTKNKSRPRSRVIVDDSTDYAKPTISSGPPAISAQDVADVDMPIRQQKSSFTISSNGQSDRNGGGASTAPSGQSTLSTQPTTTTTTQNQAPPTPAGVTTNNIKKTTSPDKPLSVPDTVKRRPPSPRVRPKKMANKQIELQKKETLPVATVLPAECPGSGSDEHSTASPSIVSQDSSESGGNPEYTGPKLYVKPASKSNRPIITNAIAHCVLAGTVNQNTKDKVLQEVAKSEYKHFVILFRNAGLQFRGLYGYSPDSDDITKFYGTGPRHVTPKMIESLYKYNSGDKSFSKIPSKTMSVQIDGITIANHLWQSKKPSGGKRH